MNRDEKFVITINRELGSGGRTVGEKLAAKLNVSFYDKAVIKELQKKYNLDVAEIEKMKGQKHQWLVELKNAFIRMSQSENEMWYYQAKNGADDGIVTTDDMFKVEKQILREIADNESCVIAGRSGFYVLGDHPNHLSIMIQASLPNRIDRLVRKQGISAEQAEKDILKVDAMRERYVKKYAGVSRYDTRNYDLVINSDGLREDEIVDLIIEYIG